MLGGPDTRASVGQCRLHQLHSHYALLTQRSKGRADSELHFYLYPDKQAPEGNLLEKYGYFKMKVHPGDPSALTRARCPRAVRSAHTISTGLPMSTHTTTLVYTERPDTEVKTSGLSPGLCSPSNAHQPHRQPTSRMGKLRLGAAMRRVGGR